MKPLATRVWALLFFYRSVAPFMLGITGLLIVCVQLPGLREGWAAGALPMLLLVKGLTGPAVWYLAEQLRPNQYWLYYNLGLSRGFLWAGVGLLDGAIFLGLAWALAASWA